VFGLCVHQLWDALMEVRQPRAVTDVEARENSPLGVIPRDLSAGSRPVGSFPARTGCQMLPDGNVTDIVNHHDE